MLRQLDDDVEALALACLARCRENISCLRQNSEAPGEEGDEGDRPGLALGLLHAEGTLLRAAEPRPALAGLDRSKESESRGLGAPDKLGRTPSPPSSACSARGRPAALLGLSAPQPDAGDCKNGTDVDFACCRFRMSSKERSMSRSLQDDASKGSTMPARCGTSNLDTTGSDICLCREGELDQWDDLDKLTAVHAGRGGGDEPR